jgi:ribose-phosphate pyrophosphokinase
MRYLHLTEGFRPHISSVFHCIDYEYTVFNGGEPHIRLKDSINGQDIVITIRLKTPEDFIKLMIATDALKRCKANRIILFAPYFPGARQDRVENPGESLSSKVYADMINIQGYHSVQIFDPHSDVTPALINNCCVIDNEDFAFKAFKELLGKEKTKNEFVLVSPDAGALKKAGKLSKKLYNIPVVTCLKERDTKTGKLSGFKVVDGVVEGKECIIVDDICDGGGTFIGVAKELKKIGAKSVYLVVSHGIFSRGFGELKRYFDKIYTTNSWRSHISMESREIEKGSEIVKIINL